MSQNRKQLVTGTVIHQAIPARRSGGSRHVEQFNDDVLPVSDGGEGSPSLFFAMFDDDTIEALKDRVQSAIGAYRRATGADNQMPVAVLYNSEGQPTGVSVWKLATPVVKRNRVAAV